MTLDTATTQASDIRTQQHLSSMDTDGRTHGMVLRSGTTLGAESSGARRGRSPRGPRPGSTSSISSSMAALLPPRSPKLAAASPSLPPADTLDSLALDALSLDGGGMEGSYEEEMFAVDEVRTICRAVWLSEC